ncbi:restriction endonuclease subunit S [Synechococcus lacustris]|uniref:restriction endonuclease subunit S n=1 Tax=Synechococcus lacustris TaxID=2116544 RepID=UPI0020CD1FE2|nr:restriction endonuclease subunit S [Synechococcus lacustris]MCP9812641.1 restriction endonuclease subunit S [Synechococcus lacustris Maggiore-St4-Slac]
MKTGWQTKKLGDVCDFEGGSQPPKSEFIYDEKPGYVRFLQIRDFGSDKNITYIRHSKKNRLCDESDILIGRYGASVGKILTGKAGSYNVALMKTLPNLEVLDQSWFYHFLISDEFQKPLLNVADRSAQAGFSKDDIYNFPVPVPPLAEQQRIVGLLNEAFEGLATAKANAEKNLQNARALFESHLQSVFTQRGPGWVEKSLGEVGKVSMCKRIFKEETTTTGDIPFYKIGTFGKEPDAFIPIQIYNEYRTKYSFPKKGDVLISASGTIGRRVRYDGEPAYFQDSNIVWIDNDEERVLNDFLYHFYGACKWNSTKGATISRLYNDNLRGIVIAFPESHQEQRLIVTQLDDLHEETQRLARLYERKCAALEALKKSLLHQAFSGEL